jgi:hypothetical protein
VERMEDRGGGEEGGREGRKEGGREGGKEGGREGGRTCATASMDSTAATRTMS